MKRGQIVSGLAATWVVSMLIGWSGAAIAGESCQELYPGAICNDDNPCTFMDRCNDLYQCTGSIYSCPAPTGCQEQVKCDGLGGCVPVFKDQDASCSTGDVCMPGGQCDGQGLCIPGTAAFDETDCSTEPCKPAKCQSGVCVDGASLPSGAKCVVSAGVCSYNGTCSGATCEPGSTQTHHGKPCDDGNPCTQNDKCGLYGDCQGTPYTCDDPNPCMSSICNGSGLCTVGPKPDDSPCQDGDGDPCTIGRCRSGFCLSFPDETCNQLPVAAAGIDLLPGDGSSCTGSPASRHARPLALLLLAIVPILLTLMRRTRLFHVGIRWFIVLLVVSSTVAIAPDVSARRRASKQEDVYPSLAIGRVPFVTASNTSRIGLGIVGEYRTAGNDVDPDILRLTTSLEGEWALIARWLALGLGVRFDYQTRTADDEASGMIHQAGGFRALDFGLKVTLVDDGKGGTFAIMGRASTLNLHSGGAYVDAVTAGGGLLGSLAWGRFHLMGMLAATHTAPLKDRYGFATVEQIEWAMQPGFAVARSHYLLGDVAGVIEIRDSGGYTHYVNLGLGYQFAARLKKGAIRVSVMVLAPVNHTSGFDDFGGGVKAVWDF